MAPSSQQASHAMAKELAELKGASSASWDAAKQGFVDAYRDLRQAYDRAAGELRK
jgi:hypothetical protein